MSVFQIQSIRTVSKHRMFFPTLAVTVGLGLMIGASLIAAEAVVAPGRSADDFSAVGEAEATDLPKKSKGRVREGTKLVDKRGFFKQRGDGATFHAEDGSLKIEGLENLNLQRVVLAIGSPGKRNEIVWLVSGTVTEFQSGNYLLIDRAIQLSKTSVKANSR